MTARAKVEHDFEHDGVAIWLGRKGDGELSTVLPLPNPVFEHHEAGEILPSAGPSLRLPEDIARALFEALARHFGGHPETVSLRKDYESERARVDRLQQAIIDANMTQARALYDQLPPVARER